MAAHTKNPQFSTNYKSVQDAPAAPPKITGRQYVHFIITSFLKPYGACFIICFVQNFDFSVLETIATILTGQFYKFKDFQNSLLYPRFIITLLCVTVTISTREIKAVICAFLLEASKIQTIYLDDD